MTLISTQYMINNYVTSYINCGMIDIK